MERKGTVLRISSSGASDEFYGDSDADENPFEHASAHGTSARSGGTPSITFGPGPSSLPQGLSERETRISGGVVHVDGSSRAANATVSTAPGDHWRRRFPSSKMASTSFPSLSGGNPEHYLNRPGLGRGLPSVDMVDTEVETETEGETENDDSDGEMAKTHHGLGTCENGNSGPVGGSATEPSAHVQQGSSIAQSEWVNRVDRQLRNARIGEADPHAMRQLLRKAGFIPADRRKDVWRLLILGRVDAGLGAGAGATQADIRALDAAILSTSLDLDNQRVVRVDVERTRPALEQFKRSRVKNMLARVLTHHCKTHGVGYKQGMHEVLAPFVALSDPELPTSDISLCYGAFIKRFLPYAFNKDEEFLALQICFRLFRILLLYHHPRLCRFLDQYQLQPELYATPWFLTLFASSLDLPRLYEVWDFYLYWGDPALHHFVVLAFVMGNAQVILQAEEANLPETMCRLSVGMKSVEELRALMRTAKDLMLNTPKSFRKILRSALYANLSQSQMNLVLNTLQVSSCIPVSAEEVISYILHKNPHRQLDQEADNEDDPDAMAAVVDDSRSSTAGAGNFNGGGSVGATGGAATGRHRGHVGGDEDRDTRRKASPSPQRMAERAAMRSLRGHRQYIILDCRPKRDFESFRLAPALHLDPDLLELPDELDAKLKEFNPLQGAAHFCLVGAGGEGSNVGHRKNTKLSDLSGEAMGLRPMSLSKTDSVGAGGARSDRDTDGHPESSGSRDKDGGFNWMGGLSKALSRAQEAGAAKGDEAIGREEDEQVARFVLMLLQYNFPYISHVRGDMVACLQELSSQALDEMNDRLFAAGDSHETLHGVLIGSEADRLLEEVTHRSPEKKGEGLFAGLAKWSKDKADATTSDSTGGAGETNEPSTRRPSWMIQASDRGEGGLSKAKKGDERQASRGRGGMGRREADDSYVEVCRPQDQAGEAKAAKRRLFGGVLNRFDKSDGARNGGSGEGFARLAVEVNTVESSFPSSKDGPSFPSEARRWLTPGGARGSKAGLVSPRPERAGDRSGTAVPDSGGTALGVQVSEEEKPGVPRPSATWVKPNKGAAPAPDRFARFLGKVLGVRDDALPDEGTVAATTCNAAAAAAAAAAATGTGHASGVGGRGEGDEIDGGNEADDVGGSADRSGNDGSVGGVGGSSPESGIEHAVIASTGARQEATGGDDDVGNGAHRPHVAEAARDAPSSQRPGVQTMTTAGSSSNSSSSGHGGAQAPPPASAEPTAVTATPVYSTTTAVADALPVAVAVAIPVADGTPAPCRSDATRPSLRPSRSHRSIRTANATAASAEAAAAGGGGGEGDDASTRIMGESVLISDWVAREQRGSGGRVRVFSAQRVLEGKVQKRCRLAVSPKYMTQFDHLHEGNGGTRGVLVERRGLRHLSRITSRKKHADLIVFHFKSRTGSVGGGGSGGDGAAAPSTTGSSSSSRRLRNRTTPLSASASTSADDNPGRQADVLYYFMKEHTECLRMVKENYRKVTQGGAGAAASASTASLDRAAAGATGASSRRPSRQPVVDGGSGRSNRQTARAAAGAVAGAAGIMVGATAGVAAGAAAGVAVGAAYLAGHRKGGRDGQAARSSSPSRSRRSARAGGPTREATSYAERKSSGGWIPIDTAAEERRRSDGGGSGSGGGGRRQPSSAGASRRLGPSGHADGTSRGHSRGSRAAGSSSGGGSSSRGRGKDGPTWLG